MTTLVHVDDGVAILSHSDPLHCNTSNSHLTHSPTPLQEQQASRWAIDIRTRHLNVLLYHLDVLLRVLRQVLVVSDALYAGLPAWKRDVLHLTTITDLQRRATDTARMHTVQEGQHVPPRPRVPRCWTGSNRSSCPYSCMTQPPLSLPVCPICPVWSHTFCTQQENNCQLETTKLKCIHY